MVSGDMRLDEVPEPVCRPGHVIAEPLCVQPSVTEAQLAFGIPTLAYEAIKRRLETEAPVQLFGHEFCGPSASRRLAKAFTSGSRPGDRVANARGRNCPAAPARSALRARTTSAARDRSSAFSFPAVSPMRGPSSPRSRRRCSVDDRISDSEAACLQSLSDSVAAVETAGIAIGDSVAIYGQGSMGLECLQIARSSGAGLIVTVDVREESCRVSRELGADVAFNAKGDDPVGAIQRLTGGNGADVVFECAGGSPKQGLAGTRSLMQAIESVSGSWG